MAIDAMIKHLGRRGFVKAAGATFMTSLYPAKAQVIFRSDSVFASAYRSPSGDYGVAVFAESGEIINAHPLPVRGHDIAVHRKSGLAVAFARRPGTIAVAFNSAHNSEPTPFHAGSGRHFYGHGVFSSDGRLLYASENNFADATGVIGVYDATHGFERIGEFPSGGTGPHDLVLLNDAKTLAIANGGIETHPDFGQTKLNLSTMAPSLCFVDPTHGTLIERLQFPVLQHRLSIRHLACDQAGGVHFACQYEGPQEDLPPLHGWAAPGQEIQLTPLAAGDLALLRNYVGSIAFSVRSRSLALTSPRGNIMLVVDIADGKVISRRRLANICGVSAAHKGFIATTGNGILCREPDHDPGDYKQRHTVYGWDNHVAEISAGR